MQAVILAAGKGTRLLPLTETTPKALLDIRGKTLLEHILTALPDEITKIVIVVGHQKEQIKKRIRKIWNEKPVRFVVQNPLDGTGGAVTKAKEYLHDRFLVVNGDDLYEKADLERLLAHPLGILLKKTKRQIEYSALVDETGRFVGIERDPPAAEIKYQICGAYLLDERFFRYPLIEIPVRDHTEYSLPHTLVEMAKDLPIHTEYVTRWQPVGTQEELKKARLS